MKKIEIMFVTVIMFTILLGVYKAIEVVNYKEPSISGIVKAKQRYKEGFRRITWDL